MTVNVLIEELDTGGYRATLLGWPDSTAKGATEEEALDRLREAAQARLERAKIVPLDLGVEVTPNPWLQISELFKGNPLLDEVDEAIAAHRRELDEEMAQP
jgi:predicted RNase H-like HicB family nuclease